MRVVGIDSATVRADATAAVGPPAEGKGIPLIFSECEYGQAVAGQGGLPPQGSGVPEGSQIVLYAHYPKPQNPDDEEPEDDEEPPENPNWNYCIDIFSKWWRNYFYFCTTYASPSPRAISPTFETRFARMEYGTDGHYTLSYFRHTGQWWEVYPDLTLDEALQQIGDDPLFHP